MLKDKCELKIYQLDINHIPLIVSAFNEIGWNKPAKIYEEYLEEQKISEREIWLGLINEQFVGYVTLKRTSGYLPFRQNGIPEIKDLNVLPKYRNRGIGSQLLKFAENSAKGLCDYIGIGVGLSKDYGSAQKLYIKNGYIPDGEGITYNYAAIKYGNYVKLDDDLILWFTKKLR